jgi:hypothetical protein
MESTAEQTKPQARSEGLVIQELSDEVLVYDLERDKAHCLNQTAAIVWKNCDGKNSVSDLAQILSKESGLHADEDVVWLALNQLGKARLMPERRAIPNDNKKLSRRDVMRKVGLATIVALPLVTSILVPTAALGGTQCGSSCASPSDCPNPVCNQCLGGSVCQGTIPPKPNDS